MKSTANISKIVVLGAGISGLGAAKLAVHHNIEVILSEYRTLKPEVKRTLEAMNVPFEENGHTLSKMADADYIIVSPGIGDKAPIIQELKALGKKLISEIEWGYYFVSSHQKIIAITGSNGKTTTTSLTGHILQKAGFEVAVCGNIGVSFAEAVIQDAMVDYYVIELSSFQLDRIIEFRPFIAMLLNISPDHLDRYDYELANYAAAKWRITENQKEADFLILSREDLTSLDLLENKNTQAQVQFFSHEKEDTAAYIKNEQLIINNQNNNSTIMSLHDLSTKGKHNASNSMAAGIAAKILDIRKEVIRESLSDFKNVEHRLEFVASVCGIEFINDSKATNVNATWFALESQQNPVVWIVGGVDKGNDYSELEALVNDKVKAIVCLGSDNAKIIDAFEGCVERIVEASNMEEAVGYAYRLGKKGDAVLLSPACASFDLFENYEDRGIQFKSQVRSL